jgi:hypothetical protein
MGVAEKRDRRLKSPANAIYMRRRKEILNRPQSNEKTAKAVQGREYWPT